MNTLNGAFVGDGLLRYGPWSAELDVDWVSATRKKTFPALTNVPQATLKTEASVVYVSPGIGYQLIPNFAPNKVSFDVRAGFSYFDASASAAFAESRFGGTRAPSTCLVMNAAISAATLGTRIVTQQRRRR